MTDMPINTGLKFFGAITASATHELKNRFAIVNEQAGLLADFVAMAEAGKSLDPERLSRLSASVKKQVALADELLRRMNRFAHSVDQMTGDADMAELLDTISSLVQRTADRRNVTLEVRLPDPSPRVYSSSFWLMNLIWILVDGAMGPSTGQRTLTLSCESSAERTVIRIDGADSVDNLEPVMAEAEYLAEALRVQVSLDPDRRSLSVVMTK